MKKLTILTSLLLAALCGFAQEEEKTSRNYPINEGWAATFQIAPTFTAADLSTAEGSDIGLKAALGVQKAINPSIDWRLQFAGGALKGSKNDQYFKGSTFELNTTFKFKLLTFIDSAKFAPMAIKPYLYGGIAVDRMKAERFNSANDASIEKFDGTTVLSIPLGIGVDYELTESLAISLEAGLSLLKTDMMDAWESNTKDNRMDDGSTKTTWILFGIKDNEDNKWQDMYGTVSIGVSYKF